MVKFSDLLVDKSLQGLGTSCPDIIPSPVWLRNIFALVKICCLIYFTGWSSVVKASKLRARSTSDLSTYNLPTDSDILCNKSHSVPFYFDSYNKKIENMNESFRVFNDSAILNRLLSFWQLLSGLKRIFLWTFWMTIRIFCLFMRSWTL